MSSLSNPKPFIVLFDGVCNLCNSSVNFIIDHDRKGKFKFAALQSDAGKRALEPFSEKIADSVLVVANGRLYQKSSAALYIASKLGFPYNLFGIFYIIPRFVRNPIYDWIARNRYRWFGKRESCRMPTPELKERFL